jgi:5-methylcytosine-specific restriction endonuclease McrA
MVDCPHSNAPIVRKPTRAGTFNYTRQCQDCGQQVGQFIGRERVMKETGGKEPGDWSEQLEWREHNERMAEMDAEYAARRARYGEYLSTPAWRAKRQVVLDREGGLCQGCRSAKATQVHHLTYDHVFNELLFELVALCDACHETAHAGRDDYDGR